MSRLISSDRITFRDLPYIEDPTNAAWDLQGGIDPASNLSHFLNGRHSIGLVSRFSAYETEKSRLEKLKHDLKWGRLVLIKDRPTNPVIRQDTAKEGREQWVVIVSDPMKQSLANNFISRAYSNEPVNRKQQPPKPIEKLVKAVTSKKPEPTHFVELNFHYGDHDSTPVRGAPYQLTFADGSTARGKLNDQGFARHEGIPPGQCKVVYGDDESINDDIEELQQAFKDELQNIISEAQREAKNMNSVETGLFIKSLVYAGAALTGGWDTVTSLGDLVAASGKGLGKLGMSQLDLYKNIISGDIDEIERKLKAAADSGFTSYQESKETAEAINLLFRDPIIWGAIADFPGEYWDALHPVEKTRKFAPVVIDILIILFTAGIGTTIAIASKGEKAVGLAKKAGEILKKLLALFRKKKHKVEQKGGSNQILEAEVEKPKKPGPTVVKKYDNLMEMDKEFIGEEKGTVWPTKVKYLDTTERKKYELNTVNGKLLTSDNKLFDTSDAGSAFSGKGNAIFVMDDSGKIYASNKHVRGKFHHSSFLSGEPVASAGELVVKDGVLKSVTRKSGHYKPSAEQLDQFIDALGHKGVNMKKVKIGGGL